MPVHSHEYLGELYQGLWQDLWKPTHVAWDVMDTFIDLTFPVKMVAGVTKIVPPVSRAKVKQAIDQLITSDPAVTRKPLGADATAKGRADRIDTWGALVLQGLARDMMLPPMKTFGAHLLTYGYANLFGPRWKEEAWPMLPKRKTKAAQEARDAQMKTLFPFSAQVPNPRNIILDPFEGKEPPYGFLVTTRTVDRLRREYPEREAELHGKPFDMRRVVAYWSAEQHIVWMTEGEGGSAGGGLVPGGIVLLDKENPYPFVPFLQAFAGFGSESSLALPDSLKRLSQGILSGVEGSVTAYAEAVTAIGEMVQRFAYQHYFVPQGQEEEIADAMAKGLVVGVEGQVTMEQMPSVPPFVEAFMAGRLADIDSGTYGDVLRGVRPQGVSTASQHAQIVAKAKQVFNVPMQQVNHVASLFLGNCMKLVETYADPVTVSGYLAKRQKRGEETLKGEDFEGNYQVEVDYAAADPIEQAAKAEQYTALWAQHAIDWETLMREGLHYPDITEVEKGRWVEGMVSSPQVQQAVFAEVQRRWGEKTGQRPGGPVSGPAAGGLPVAMPQDGGMANVQP